MNSTATPPALPTLPAPSTPATPPTPPQTPQDLISSLQRKDLDELARRLADPLERLQRAEARLFHERSGGLL